VPSCASNGKHSGSRNGRVARGGTDSINGIVKTCVSCAPIRQRDGLPRQKLSTKRAFNARYAIIYGLLTLTNLIFRSDYASDLQLTMHQAAIQKRLQSSRSWSALFIYKPSRGYAGLALELKQEGTVIYLKRGPRKGLLTSNPHVQEQALMLQELNNFGYFARSA
jgi:hypothetical protein